MKTTWLTRDCFARQILIMPRLLIVALVAPVLAHAQAPDAAAGYPTQPIRFVVPYSAGGGTDVIVRIVAKYMSEAWNTSVLVDNRVGAGGVTGSHYVTTQKPDGAPSSRLRARLARSASTAVCQ